MGGEMECRDAEGHGDIEAVFGAVHGYVGRTVARLEDTRRDTGDLIAKDECEG